MSEPAERPGRVPTILVVDDEPRNRSLLRAILARDHEVVEAENGIAALEVLDRTPVDLVLLDIMMPRMNGLDACREIKARLRDDFVPVLLLTALTDQEDRNAGLEAGADDFLSKPVDMRELRLRVRAFLRLREQEALIRKHVSELRDLEHLKDDLFSLIVHDMRNPLAGVIGFLELLSDPAQPLERSFASKALAAARKLADLVEDVLTVTRLEGRREGEIRREPAEVGTVVREALATLEGDARTKGVTLAIAASPRLVARLDAKLFRRAVENVVANGLKYSPRGTTIDLDVREERSQAVVEVADRGPGIPAPLRTAIFEKFVTVEGAEGRVRRGYGLGLHLVKLVADAHGGRAAVRDRDGGGAVFEIAVPVA